MPNYITIYLQSQLKEINVEQVKKGISKSDWWTLGEEFNISEAEVDLFINNLILEEEPLQFSVPTKRPVQIQVVNRIAAVQEEIAELGQQTLPAKVKAFCNNIQSVVIIELGLMQSKTMFEVVAFEIAYWLSENFTGLIRSTDEFWYDYNENRWKPIV